MTKAFEGSANQYYIDGYLRDNLDQAKKVIREDWDMLFVFDGMEGSGKSVLAMQCAYYLDPDPKLFDRYAFSPGQFRKAVLNAKPYQAVIYDEAHSGLNARAAMTMINRNLISMLSEIRQKNLFVFVILPTFFDLDKYVALWRSRALIHVYTAKGMQRGYFSFYNASSKKLLYMKGKKLYKYGVQKPNFIGRFTNYYPLNEQEYRARKRDALGAREKAQEDVEIQEMMYSMMWEKIMKLDNILTHNQKMAIMDLKPATYFRRLKQWKEMQSEDAPERVSV